MKTRASITQDTTIKELLSVRKDETLEALIALNKNFSKLKNPLLRGLFAGKITIKEACKVAGCELTDFLAAMQKIGFQVHQETAMPPQEAAKEEKDFNPALEKDVVELDVRPALQSGQDPLQTILKCVENLQTGQCLKIIATFEPVPLIHLLRKKGFGHVVEVVSPQEVYTWFRRAEGAVSQQNSLEVLPPAGEGDFEEILTSFGDRVRTLDVTMLEMPKPMITILENLQTLPPEEALFVYHKKIPVYLLPHLQERGFRYLFKETENGKVNLLIYKNEHG